MLKYFKNYQITWKSKKPLKIFNKFYQIIKSLVHQVNCKCKCKEFNKKKTKVNLQIATVTNKIKNKINQK
jgi:hypothetical protein